MSSLNSFTLPSMILEITTDKEAIKVEPLINRFEQSTSKIIKMNINILEDIDENEPCIYLPEIYIYDKKTKIKKYYYNTIGYFTNKDVIDFILDFEKISRPLTNWFGGIDCHHIFPELIEYYEPENAYIIFWGS